MVPLWRYEATEINEFPNFLKTNNSLHEDILQLQFQFANEEDESDCLTEISKE